MARRSDEPIDGGLNTAVEYGSRTYHVQTQCSLRGAPVIESLIYHGGQTLVRFTSSYEDIATRFGFNGDDGQHLLEAQHADLIRKVRHGLLRGDDEADAGADRDEAPAAVTPAGSAEPATAEVRLIDAHGVTVDPVEVDDPSVRELLQELDVAIDTACGNKTRRR